MSEALKIQNARQDVELVHHRMVEAYDRWYRLKRPDQLFEGDYWQDYQNKLNIYRDLCTAIVERLLRNNPKVLEEMIML